MSKLTRYIVLGIAVCMLLAVGIYGVYSATRVEYTLSGSISYEVGDFEATFNFTHISGAENANEEPLSEGDSLLSNATVDGTVESTGNLTLNQTLYFTNSSPNAVNDIIIALNVTHEMPYSVRVTVSPGAAFLSGGSYSGLVTCQASTNQSSWGNDASIVVAGNQTEGTTIYIKFSSTIQNLQNLPATNTGSLVNVLLESV